MCLLSLIAGDSQAIRGESIRFQGLELVGIGDIVEGQHPVMALYVTVLLQWS
jgi:hypothetical protein